MRTVLIAAAGTGGHVFPALAVAEQLRDFGWRVIWLGTDEGRLESRVVPAAGFELQTITMQGLRGKGLARKVSLPWTLWQATRAAKKILQAQQVQLVLSFGGYVCAPAGLAARWLGVPLLVHEQNAIAGLTNRLLARLATHTMVGFAAARQQLPQAEVTGNPLRREWQQAATNTNSGTSKSLRILVVGGSLGAQALNQHVPAVLAQLAERLKQPLAVTHQCGRERAAEVRDRYQALALEQVQVTEFIDDMHSAYNAADIVICRAGALTVAELAMLGKVAVFVPLPHAVDDHQTANARELVRAGAAMLLPQTELQQQAPLLQQLLQLSEPSVRHEMQQRAQAAAFPQATQRVVENCERYANPEQMKAGHYDAN